MVIFPVRCPRQSLHVGARSLDGVTARAVVPHANTLAVSVSGSPTGRAFLTRTSHTYRCDPCSPSADTAKLRSAKYRTADAKSPNQLNGAVSSVAAVVRDGQVLALQALQGRDGFVVRQAHFDRKRRHGLSIHRKESSIVPSGVMPSSSTAPPRIRFTGTLAIECRRADVLASFDDVGAADRCAS